ncbi:rarD protein [Parvularcula bermudensis HTCC2503]|uniref:RarD protein n=1 Tax=Parvularcula bermudensis (strain ATCC BAA-594 / HTCC2503 / KCTC 12087) TaxID=314260 RepID=E0TDJ6_PARBH|nr:EamA family transporter RarD [Parvularcula bermudensis]ADM08751.1 rarD protein [Parvularcula bermudensis HTCC2503]
MSGPSSLRTGLLAGTLAYTLWGFLPFYFIVLRGISPIEIFTDRILFAVPFGLLVILARSQWGEVVKGLRSPKVVLWLLASALAIAGNWILYIVAVQEGRVFEVSLGYYINPLVYVLVGVVVMGERLRRLQILAVLLAGIGVTILTVYGGRFPLFGLILAVTFTFYGYSRKRVAIGAMPGLFIETLLLSPLALGLLIWLVASTDTGLEAGLSGDFGLLTLLMLAGPITVTPLLFFAIAARRLTLSTIGFLQFIGPTLAFGIGLLDGEPFTPAYQICFAFIWLGVALFIGDALQHRAQRPSPVPRAVAASLSTDP